MSDVILFEPPRKELAGSSAYSDAMSKRAMMDIRETYMSADRRPRDVMRSYVAAMKEAELYSFAEDSFYSFIRGGKLIEGASIRMLEMIARHYRNLSSGWAEVERYEDKSLCEAWCNDIEANNPYRVVFTVWHTRDKSGGKPELLTQERDIYEKIANYCARRLRTCMEKQIPSYIVADCLAAAKATIGRGDASRPLEQRVQKMVLGYESLGVTKEMIEHRLGHAATQINQGEFVELWGIYKSIQEKQADRSEFFEFRTADTTTISDINAKAAAQTDDQRRTDVIAKIRAKYKDRQEKGLSVANITVNMDTLETLKTNQLMAVLGMLSK